MYKDPDKQREANRKAQAKFKAKGITEQGITTKGITQIPKEQMCITDDWQKAIDDKPKRGKDIKCFADLPPDVQEAMLEGGLVAVAVVGKPGDADYNGICTPEWRAERGR